MRVANRNKHTLVEMLNITLQAFSELKLEESLAISEAEN